MQRLTEEKILFLFSFLRNDTVGIQVWSFVTLSETVENLQFEKPPIKISNINQWFNNNSCIKVLKKSVVYDQLHAPHLAARCDFEKSFLKVVVSLQFTQSL